MLYLKKQKIKDIYIEIHNEEKMKLNLNNREIKFFQGLIDITII